MTWQKGQSGNTSGRPKGFAGVAKLILKETANGADLVQWALSIWRDTTQPMADRRWAFEWLSDRCMGKPVAMNVIADLVGGTEAKVRRNLSALPESAIDEIDRIFRENENAPPRALAVIDATSTETKP